MRPRPWAVTPSLVQALDYCAVLAQWTGRRMVIANTRASHTPLFVVVDADERDRLED